MVLQVFLDLQEKFDQEDGQNEALREAVNELWRATRATSAKLSKAHSLPHSKAKELVEATKPEFDALKQSVASLASLIKPLEFYRFRDRWSNALQTACGQVTFAVYLEDARLATPADIEDYLGIKVNTDNEDITEFVATLDEYLLGLISLFPELSRLAVNSVITNDVKRPQEISEFASEVYSGFQLLNLKNDALRRRFDGIKYDIKKIEEVQYDLRVRGLN
ncbi:Translin-1 [Coemansia sp. RSA 552]|nr:Translin-1 [Coemansia sp. RSA 552]